MWSGLTLDIGGSVRLNSDPFFRAVRDLRRTEPRFRRVPDLTYAEDPGSPTAVLAAVDVLLPGLEANRRRPAADRGLVMIVGDSQSQSLAYGLERWSLDHVGPLVWNAGVGGCGLVGGGLTIGIEGDQLAPASTNCERVVEDWARGVAASRPDRVIVWSSVRDLQRRQLDGWPAVEGIGDDRFDDHMLSSYVAAVDAFAAQGAEVTWIVPPCVQRMGLGTSGPGSPFDPATMDHLRTVILPALVRERPEVTLYDLGAHLCPGGRYLESVDGVGVLRPDGLHLSVEGTAWLAGLVGEDLLDLDR